MDSAIIYVVIIALFAGLPEIIDIFLAYRSQDKARNLLIEKASVNNLQLSELKQFLKETGKAPPGIPNLTRGMLALTVILIMGIAIFHLLVYPPVGDSKLIDNVLSMLGGLLAAITGFYFGGKAADAKGEQKSAKGTAGEE